MLQLILAFNWENSSDPPTGRHRPCDISVIAIPGVFVKISIPNGTPPPLRPPPKPCTRQLIHYSGTLKRRPFPGNCPRNIPLPLQPHLFGESLTEDSFGEGKLFSLLERVHL